jgi:hypothetical protein
VQEKVLYDYVYGVVCVCVCVCLVMNTATTGLCIYYINIKAIKVCYMENMCSPNLSTPIYLVSKPVHKFLCNLPVHSRSWGGSLL